MKKYLKKHLKIQIVVSFLLLLFFSVIHFSPALGNSRIKNAVWAIVNKNTKISNIYENIKKTFVQSEELEAYAPVTDMTAPVFGKIIQPFGAQDAQTETFHYGVLIQCAPNETVKATADGIIEDITQTKDKGTCILLRHNESLTTCYCRLEKLSTQVGDHVKKGDILAETVENNTLYVELKKNNTYLNPTDYFEVRASS